MIRMLRLAWRLWRSNPRVFWQRLRLVLRSPIRNLLLLIASQRRHRALTSAYRQWFTACQSAPPAIPADGPLISVIMPVKDVAAALLDEAIESVRAQTYQRWELCIADDASTQPHVRPSLERHAAADSRIRVIYREQSGHIAAASNTALAEAGGEFIVLLDNDDRLEPLALAAVAEVIVASPTVDIVYSDEDKLSADGQRLDPFFKPAWSPTLFTATNYLNHLVALRRELVHAVGGFRDAMVGSQDYDLLLRVEERARSIAHLPRVLYSWRMAPGSTAIGSAAKPYAVLAARRALEEAVTRRGLDAVVADGHLNGQLILRRSLPSPCRVSLIVHGSGDVWRKSQEAQGVDVVDVTFLDEITGSAADGYTVVSSIDALTGDYLVWLAADESPADATSIGALIEALQAERVTAAGGCTVSRAGTVLQAGLTVAASGQPIHAFAGLPALPLHPFYLNFKDLAREVAAVSVTCAAMRRTAWDRLGGWGGDLPPQLAMTDLCLRGLDAGNPSIYAPRARFVRQRPLPAFPSVQALAWSWVGFADPFWHPALTPERGDGVPFRCPPDRAARVRPVR